MADKEINLSRKNYAALVKAVAANGWKCTEHENAMQIEYGVNGDNVHMDFVVAVDVQRQLVRLHSVLPFKFTRDKFSSGAVIVGAANYALADGCFDYNIDDGSITYKITMCCRGSVLSEEAYLYMLNYAPWAIDKLSSYFLAFNSEKRTITDITNELINL